jgi:hypothetical protein
MHTIKNAMGAKKSRERHFGQNISVADNVLFLNVAVKKNTNTADFVHSYHAKNGLI